MTVKDKRIWIAVGMLAVLTALALLFASEKQWDWRESYRQKSRDPYGTYVISELLRAYHPGQPLVLLQDSLGELPRAYARSNYVFIGEGLLLDSTDTGQLLHFVEQGNHAFIASRVLPDLLAEQLFPSLYCRDRYLPWSNYATLVDSTVRFGLIHPDFREPAPPVYRYPHRGDFLPYRWQYIDTVYFCAGEAIGFEMLGTLNDAHANFARLSYGEGYFFLHTNPIAFSNVQLLDEGALQYAERVFSHLLEGPVYWDEHTKVSERLARSHNYQDEPPPDERRLDARSPLQYVLAQPSLTWAWYLLLILVLLYLLFRAKRRQRIVPVLEKNENTSLEFVATIGRLFFLQNDHRRLAQLQMRLFRAFAHRHYGIQRQELDREFVEKLAGKSEIPEKSIQELLEHYQQIEASAKISADDLVAFHRKADYFYKHCK